MRWKLDTGNDSCTWSRRWTREWTASVPVDIITADGKRLVAEGILVNINGGGACARTVGNVRNVHQVILSIPIPGAGQCLRLPSRINWSSSNGEWLAVSFHSPLQWQKAAPLVLKDLRHDPDYGERVVPPSDPDTLELAKEDTSTAARQIGRTRAVVSATVGVLLTTGVGMTAAISARADLPMPTVVVWASLFLFCFAVGSLVIVRWAIHRICGIQAFHEALMRYVRHEVVPPGYDSWVALARRVDNCRSGGKTASCPFADETLLSCGALGVLYSRSLTWPKHAVSRLSSTWLGFLFIVLAALAALTVIPFTVALWLVLAPIFVKVLWAITALVAAAALPLLWFVWRAVVSAHRASDSLDAQRRTWDLALLNCLPDAE